MPDFRTRYQAGVNLGGWLSQYPALDYDHFDSFIRESDIERIATWGMDHVRLPIDYPVLEGSGDGEYSERGFEYVDDCVRWCRDHDLDLILDLHEAPGYSFDTQESNRLFQEKAPRDQFVDVWCEITERYDSTGDEVAFELLNEVVDPPNDRWNALVHRTVEAVREIDENRTVLVGGEEYNAIDELTNIDLLDDENVVYTFHMYEPHLFTHQHASWSEIARAYGRDVEYPGTVPDDEAFLGAGSADGDHEAFLGDRIDREWMEEAIQPAVDFREETGADVYCGEYGVIGLAPEESRVAWHRDVIDIFNSLTIGRACWTYKELSFGLVDQTNNVVNEELVEIVSQI